MWKMEAPGNGLLTNGTRFSNCFGIDHFTVVCLVTWPLNDSEAGVDLALIEISQLFLFKFLPISVIIT